MNANIGDRIRTHGWQNLSKLLSVDEDGDLHTEYRYIHRSNLREVIANSFEVIDKDMNAPCSYIVVLENGDKFVIHPSWVSETYTKESIEKQQHKDVLWVNVLRSSSTGVPYVGTGVYNEKQHAINHVTDTADYLRTVPIDVSK